MVDQANHEHLDADGWISSCAGEFLLLVERYLDGAATAEDVARLQQSLTESPVHRDAFVHLATTAGLVAEHLAPVRSCAQFEQDIHELQNERAKGRWPAANATIDQPAVPKVVSATPGDPPSASRLMALIGSAIAYVPGGEVTVGLLLISAVVGAFAGLATLIWEARQDVQQLAQQQGSGPRQVSAQVVATRDCRWISPEPRLGAPVEGKLLRVAAGVAQLTFAKGVQVVVEGPAMFEVVAAARIRLDQGRLVATVPPQGSGFTVVTPTAEVVDLGTQFGVEVDSAERTDVIVLKGIVEVKARTGPQREIVGEPMRLSAGEAVRLGKSEHMATIASDASHFSNVLRPLAPGFASAQGGVVEPSLTAVERPHSFSEDFRSLTPGLNLSLGPGGGMPSVDFSYGTFAITSGPGNRIYLGTRHTDYALHDFVLEATAILPPGENPWSDAFLGMGTSSPIEPVFEPVAPSVLAVIRIDNETDNGFETRDNGQIPSLLPSAGVEFSPKLVGKTVRLRMSWDAKTQRARLDLDPDYAGGPMQPTYTLTVDGSDNGFNASNSQLILGGGLGLQFDDVQVTLSEPAATDEPAPARQPEPR